MNMRTKFKVRSFTLSWDNRGYPKNLGSPWIRTRSLFSKTFNGVRMDPVNVPAKFEVRSFTRSWDYSDWSFRWWLRTSKLGEEEAVRGRGWYRSKEPWWVRFCAPGSSTPLFPTPPLVSQNFPHNPLGVGGWPLDYEERKCWANCPCN